MCVHACVHFLVGRGMQGFTPGSVGYHTMTAVVAVVVVGAVFTFAGLVAAEVYRSFKHERMFDALRQVWDMLCMSELVPVRERMHVRGCEGGRTAVCTVRQWACVACQLLFVARVLEHVGCSVCSGDRV
jgi:hypothetical protein